MYSYFKKTKMSDSRSKKPRFDLSSLHGWLGHHRTHGRTWKCAKIGEFHTYRCSCVEKFTFTDSEREAAPAQYSEYPPDPVLT